MVNKGKEKTAMINKDSDKKQLLWMVGFVAVVFTACLMFFLTQREKETAQAVENDTAPIQTPTDNNAPEQKVVSATPARQTSHALPESEEVVAEESENQEAKRLANWKDNFPYKPTTDPDVLITEEMLANYGHGDPTVIHNHCYLRSFFEDESRFTAQFEQLYRILEEHGRGDNPITTADIYAALWHYHHYSQPPRRGQPYLRSPKGEIQHECRSCRTVVRINRVFSACGKRMAGSGVHARS